MKRVPLLVGLGIGLAACLLIFKLQQRPHQFRVAVAGIQHETCTFCPGGDTTIADWERSGPMLEGEELLESNGYLRGFTRQAREYGDVKLIPIRSPRDPFGGSSRSWNTQEAFEHYARLIVDEIERNMPLDGVFLALHGAMAVRNVARPEAELARRVRAVVGPDVPIVATFDLHGNEDAEFLRYADMAFVTKRYPHHDWYLQGERAARALIRTMRGDLKPTTATRQPGVVTATVFQWTGSSPAMDIMERARRWEDREDGNDVYVSVFFGFPWADVPDMGATVMVTTNDDQALADRIADDMSDYIWKVREAFAGQAIPGPREGVEKIREAIAQGSIPVAVGDYSDRSGDATHILQELIDQEVGGFLYAALRDEKAIAALAASGARAGDRFSMQVGGFAGPASGRPVKIEGTLAYFGEAGPYSQVAAVKFGSNNMLIITPALIQVTSPDELRFGPVDPDEYSVIIVKSRVHFRGGFEETGYARTILLIDAPGPYIGTIALDALDYVNAPISKLYPFGIPDDRR